MPKTLMSNATWPIDSAVTGACAKQHRHRKFIGDRLQRQPDLVQTLTQGRRGRNCAQAQRAREEVVLAVVLDRVEIALAKTQQADHVANDIAVGNAATHRQRGTMAAGSRANSLRQWPIATKPAWPVSALEQGMTFRRMYAPVG